MAAVMSEVCRISSAYLASIVDDGTPTLSWREINALLDYWGRARWRVGLSGGYPEQSATVGQVELYEPRDWFQVSQLTAQGKQNPYYSGHRILSESCWSVSKELLAINMAVNLLPEPQFEAIVVRHSIGCVHQHEFTRKEQAEMLGIKPEAMDERLRRARKSIGRMLVNLRYFGRALSR
jgi:DNA-directed RNA polymerase specialized sigma24 family protein